jgi:hypothetical protein
MRMRGKEVGRACPAPPSTASPLPGWTGQGVQREVMSPPESFSFSFLFPRSSFLFILSLYLSLSPRPFLTKEKDKE